MTDEDALPSSIPCVFKRSRDLTLCGLLALAAWRQGKDKLQRLGERIGDYLKRRRAMSHHWPFLSGSISDVTADQVAQARLGFSRKSRGQYHDAPQCASLSIND